jgi:peroxisomal enoyl-CoA hydratase 2
MPTYNPERALGADGSPGEWGPASSISWDRRDVLLYAVGIGSRDLRFIYEGHPDFAVFPTFPIRWGGSGAPIPAEAVPRSPGPLTIDAERYLEMIHPLPIEGSVTAKSRCIAIHPRGKGNGFVETETVLQDESGRDCFRLVTALSAVAWRSWAILNRLKDWARHFRQKLLHLIGPQTSRLLS